jgi:broad specificity phosphatase PhoE
MNFGGQEGLHYDNLSKGEKEKLSDPNYQAPNGESWPVVKERATDYFRLLPKGNHLVFTHGGLITSYLYDNGLKEMVPNCSVVGVSLNDQKDQDLG